MTALCYFNALRELGGARRIVEDEVAAKLGSYGDERRRVIPADKPFANRRLREILELTSRESTDNVAAAKDRLAKPSMDKLGGYPKTKALLHEPLDPTLGKLDPIYRRFKAGRS